MNIRTETVYASAARTATPTAVVITPRDARAMDLVIDSTSVTATPTVTTKIEAVDELSGKAYALLTGAGLTSTGTTVLRVGLGLTAAANTVANFPLPTSVKVTCTHSDADSITYSVSAVYYE